MPPRYAYWTILIDGKATAFRAREREELLPTFNQLARKNADIAMRYFARGLLWDNPEQAQWANRNQVTARTEKRDRDWRPGGQHKDPRARFERKKKTDRGDRSFQAKSHKPFDKPRSGERRDVPKAPERRELPKAPERRELPKALERRELPKAGSAFPKRPDRPKWTGKPENRSSDSRDRRELRPDASAGKRPARWSGPPKRKPR
jgi:hypothetical protein